MSCDPSKEDPFVSAIFSIVTEEADNQEDKRVGFYLVMERSSLKGY